MQNQGPLVTIYLKYYVHFDIFGCILLHYSSASPQFSPTGVIQVGANITVSSPSALKPSRDTRGVAEWLSPRVLRLTSAQTKTVDIKHLTTAGGEKKTVTPKT